MKTIIHVNQHVIKSNRVHKKNDPVLTVKTYNSNTYAHSVEIDGPSKIIYSPDNPLSCGARVWIETEAKVTCNTEPCKVEPALAYFIESEHDLGLSHTVFASKEAALTEARQAFVDVGLDDHYGTLEEYMAEGLLRVKETPQRN